VSAAPGVPGAIVPPRPPGPESDPVTAVHVASEWMRDFWNRRAGGYAVVLEDMGLALAEALG
jgi:hypothetical protein